MFSALAPAIYQRPVYAAESAAAIADKGAALFKRKQYVEAAAAFERAYALDPRDFRVLRYAGRSWQEIGDWERALALLERYAKLETDAEARRTVQPSLDKLRAATPIEKAEALAAATRAYPHARLEEAAARALEGVGGRRNLVRAVELLEVARLAATDEAQKRRIGAEIERVRALAATAPETPAGTAPTAGVVAAGGGAGTAKDAQPALGVGAATDASGPTMRQWVAVGAGGAAIAAGATLWLLAARATETANKDFQAGDIDYASYTDARDSASLRYWGGIGLCAVGAGGAIAGWFLARRPVDASASAAWTLLPAGRGLALRAAF